MAIESVAVIGAGFMGAGIAQVSIAAGHRVTLIDTSEAAVAKGREAIAWSLGKLAKKGRAAEAPEAVLARLTTSTRIEDAAHAGLVVEAVYENIEVKQGLFAKLDACCDAHTILGSNTSTIPIGKLAEATKRPDKVIGIHFFGPVPMMKLVEVIQGAATSTETVDAVMAYVRALPKNPVLVKRDIPGFLMNRVFGAMVVEAIQLVEDGAGSVLDIDQGMCDGFNMRLGPIAIADAAGLDITLNAFNIIHELDPARLNKPPKLLERLVAEGKLGRKSGEGFYKWDKEGRIVGPATL